MQSTDSAHAVVDQDCTSISCRGLMDAAAIACISGPCATISAANAQAMPDMFYAPHGGWHVGIDCAASACSRGGSAYLRAAKAQASWARFGGGKSVSFGRAAAAVECSSGI